ncbi:MAG: protein-export chaperone SecB [Nitrospirae bacterium]|nr:protein-export chaperone SecB [Nitrospirota bacterium]
MQSLLDIDNYFVEEIAVKVNPEFRGKVVKSELNFSFDILRNGEETGKFMILMNIKIGHSSKGLGNTPYMIKLNLRGFFSFNPKADEVTINKMIGGNGLSILYGVARGIVAQVTANGPYGKFILPAANLTGALKKKAKEQEKQIVNK